MPATATAISGPAEALARIARTRDPEAWAWLLERLGPTLAAVTRRLSDDQASADDAAQEALLTLRDHAGSFTPRVDPDAEARRWIMRVAANAALDLRRARRRARDRDARAAEPGERPAREGADMERDETARIVRDALGEIGEGERAAIVLHVLGGLGYDQVAAELRCPVGTAKTRVHRGLERLRRLLGPRQQALALAGLAALLARDGAAAEALPPKAAALLDASRAGSPPPPPITGGLTMAAKLGIALAAALVVATPLALLAQSHESQPTNPTPAGGGLAAPLVVTPSSPDSASRGVPLSEAPPEARKALQAALDLKVDRVPLSDALAFVQKVGGIASISCDSSLIHALVTVQDARATVASFLEQAAAQAGGAAVWRDGRIEIVPSVPERASATNPPSAATTAPSDRGMPLSQAPEEVRISLLIPLTTPFAVMTLEDAAKAVARFRPVRIWVDPSIATRLVKAGADSVSLGTYLGAIAEQVGGQCRWRDGAIAIVPGAAGAATDPGTAQVGPADAGTPLAQAPQDARDSLQMPLTLNVAGMSASDATNLVSQLSGLRITVDRSLAAGRVTIDAADQPIGGFLEQVAQQAGGRCLWRDGGVAIVPLPPMQKHAAPGDLQPPAPRANQ